MFYLRKWPAQLTRVRYKMSNFTAVMIKDAISNIGTQPIDPTNAGNPTSAGPAFSDQDDNYVSWGNEVDMTSPSGYMPGTIRVLADRGISAYRPEIVLSTVFLPVVEGDNIPPSGYSVDVDESLGEIRTYPVRQVARLIDMQMQLKMLRSTNAISFFSKDAIDGSQLESAINSSKEMTYWETFSATDEEKSQYIESGYGELAYTAIGEERGFNESRMMAFVSYLISLIGYDDVENLCNIDTAKIPLETVLNEEEETSERTLAERNMFSSKYTDLFNKWKLANVRALNILGYLSVLNRDTQLVLFSLYPSVNSYTNETADIFFGYNFLASPNIINPFPYVSAPYSNSGGKSNITNVVSGIGSGGANGIIYAITGEGSDVDPEIPYSENGDYNRNYQILSMNQTTLITFLLKSIKAALLGKDYVMMRNIAKNYRSVRTRLRYRTLPGIPSQATSKYDSFLNIAKNILPNDLKESAIKSNGYGKIDNLLDEFSKFACGASPDMEAFITRYLSVEATKNINVNKSNIFDSIGDESSKTNANTAIDNILPFDVSSDESIRSFTQSSKSSMKGMQMVLDSDDNGNLVLPFERRSDSGLSDENYIPGKYQYIDKFLDGSGSEVLNSDKLTQYSKKQSDSFAYLRNAVISILYKNGISSTTELDWQASLLMQNYQKHTILLNSIMRSVYETLRASSFPLPTHSKTLEKALHVTNEEGYVDNQRMVFFFLMGGSYNRPEMSKRFFRYMFWCDTGNENEIEKSKEDLLDYMQGIKMFVDDTSFGHSVDDATSIANQYASTNEDFEQLNGMWVGNAQDVANSYFIAGNTTNTVTKTNVFRYTSIEARRSTWERMLRDLSGRNVVSNALKMFAWAITGIRYTGGVPWSNSIIADVFGPKDMDISQFNSDGEIFASNDLKTKGSNGLSYVSYYAWVFCYIQKFIYETMRVDYSPGSIKISTKEEVAYTQYGNAAGEDDEDKMPKEYKWTANFSETFGSLKTSYAGLNLLIYVSWAYGYRNQQAWANPEQFTSIQPGGTNDNRFTNLTLRTNGAIPPPINSYDVRNHAGTVDESKWEPVEPFATKIDKVLSRISTIQRVHDIIEKSDARIGQTMYVLNCISNRIRINTDKLERTVTLETYQDKKNLILQQENRRSLMFMSRDQLRLNLHLARSLFTPHIQNLHLPSSKSISNRQIKNMIKYLSTEDYGFLAGEGNGRKVILNIGLPSGMIENLRERLSARTGNPADLFSDFINIRVFKIDMQTGQKFKTKNFFFNMSLFIFDGGLSEFKNNSLTTDYDDSDSAAAIFEKTKKNIAKIRTHDILVNVPELGSLSNSRETLDKIGVSWPPENSSWNSTENTKKRDAILRNTVTDYYLKMYQNVTTGLYTSEDVFTSENISQTTVDPDKIQEFNTTMALNLAAHPAANISIEASREYDRIKSECERSYIFSSDRYARDAVEPKIFDRVFRVLIDERDFIPIGDDEDYEEYISNANPYMGKLQVKTSDIPIANVLGERYINQEASFQKYFVTVECMETVLSGWHFLGDNIDSTG